MKKSIPNLLGAPAASNLLSSEQWPTLVATFITILVASALTFSFSDDFHQVAIVASIGASAMLVFVIPNSPLTQPYSLLMGHFVPAIIGVSCSFLPLSLPLMATLAVSSSLLAMYLLRCIHPPGGATTLVPVIAGADAVGGYSFVIFPVMINMITLILLGILFHRYWLKNEYPSRKLPTQDTIHKHKDASPLTRLGIGKEDLRSALQEFKAFLNITEKDLAQVYGLAQQKAFTRKFGEIRCKDIMSRDVISVEYGTDLEEAWALLRLHKVKLLPVIDPQRRVIGILSLVDYLKRANLKTYEGFAERLVNFVKRSSSLHTDKPEAVGHIMAKPAFTVNEDDLIASLVPLLSDKGLHHIPVVNEQERLVGIVTQSDLIAALYTGSINQ